MKKKTVDLWDNIQFLIFGSYFLYRSFLFMRTDVLKALGSLMIVWFFIIKQLRIKRIMEKIDIKLFEKLKSGNPYSKEGIDKITSLKKIDGINNILICLGIVFAVIGYVVKAHIAFYKYGILSIVLLLILTNGMKTCLAAKNYLKHLGSAYKKEGWQNSILIKIKKIDILRNISIGTFLGAIYFALIYIFFDTAFFIVFFSISHSQY